MSANVRKIPLNSATGKESFDWRSPAAAATAPMTPKTTGSRTSAAATR